MADDERNTAEKAALKNQRSEALYQGCHDTDVTYDLDSNRLKESLILRSCRRKCWATAIAWKQDSLRLELQEDNMTTAMPKTPGLQDEPVFYMPAPYLLDAENAYSNDIKVTAEENDKGYELRYYLPQRLDGGCRVSRDTGPRGQPVSQHVHHRDKTVTQRNPPAYDAISLDAGCSNRGQGAVIFVLRISPL